VIRIGVSGWRYAGWRGDFYPTGLRQEDELTHVGERMTSVEINGSFYSLQRPTSYQRWRSSVPEDFVFAVKGSRYVTHMKALRDVETPLANFFASGPLALGPALGPLLWQLPERLAFDEGLVRSFLELLPRSHAEAATQPGGRERREAGVDPVAGEPDLRKRLALERVLPHPRVVEFGTHVVEVAHGELGQARVVGCAGSPFEDGARVVRVGGGEEGGHLGRSVVRARERKRRSEGRAVLGRPS
jgi:uncharacterized protein YecE (DUF72 family)